MSIVKRGLFHGNVKNLYFSFKDRIIEILSFKQLVMRTMPFQSALPSRMQVCSLLNYVETRVKDT